MNAGVVACSNGLSDSTRQEIKRLEGLLGQKGINLIFDDFLFERAGERRKTGKERADVLMDFYCDSQIDVIFDLSGGDIANEILPYLDYEKIANIKNRAGQVKTFWGYSDLTVVLNAIYAKTGNSGILYQVRNLVTEKGEGLLRDFVKAAEKVVASEQAQQEIQKDSLFDFTYSFFQGEELSGVVVGGNIRCLLKLAGTQYFPDLTDKVLFLEARSGLQPQMITYLGQLKQLGAFEKVGGILLGTFTQLEKEWEGMASKMVRKDDIRNERAGEIESLVKEFVGNKVPIVKTFEIGHAANSKAIEIGEIINLKKI